MDIKKGVVLFVVFLWMLVISVPVALSNGVSPYSSSNHANIDWGTLDYTWGKQRLEGESRSMARSVKGWGIPDSTPYDVDHKKGEVYTEVSMLVGGYRGEPVLLDAAEVGLGFGVATATTDASNIYAETKALSSLIGGTREYSAEARAQRSFGFWTGEGGSVTFSIDYSLSQKLFAPAGGKTLGYVRAWSWLMLHSEDDGWVAIDDMLALYEDEKFIYSNEYVHNSDGVLTLTYNAPANSWLLFETGADAMVMASPVPVPPAILLLGFGIAGLIAVKRRKIG